MSQQLLKETSEKLLQVITEAKEQFNNISEAKWSAKPAPGKWSKKEILGHLIDSASNNHQRFLRAPLEEGKYVGPSYPQDEMVTAQKFADENTQDIIDLWFSYNRHLAFIIQYINPGKLEIACYVGDYPPVPLSFVVTDYVAHLQHHLKAILS